MRRVRVNSRASVDNVNGFTMDDITTGNIASNTLKSSAPSAELDTRWQYGVTAMVALLMFSGGMAIGWTSPNIPKLLSDPLNPVTATLEESSVIAAMMDFGTGIFALPWVFLMDRIGRANTLRLAGVPMTIAWILIGVADNAIYVIVARLLAGMTFSSCLCVLAMYLGEVSSPQIRGALTIALTVANKSGLLFSYCIGPFVAFRTHAYVALVPIVLYLIASVWLPETPYYLLGAGRWQQAHDSLCKFRGAANSCIETELRTMETAVQRSKANTGTFRDLFHTRGHRRAFAIIMSLGVVQIMSGSQAVLAYSQLIFAKIGIGLRPTEVSIILASVQLVSVFVCALLVDRVGRRPLLLFSVWGTTLCNVTVMAYFMVERWQPEAAASISWLAIVAVMVFIVCYSMGLPAVNLAILGEIFPTNLKAIASLVYTMTTGILSSAVTAAFQAVSESAGSDAAFGIFAGCGIVFSVIVWFVVPETKGKPFEVILEELETHGGKKKRSLG